MIASLHGTVIVRDNRSLIIEVGGFGLRVYVGGPLLDTAIGTVVKISTYLHVTSEALDLYGFSSADELGLFQSLLKVSGVGPKSALALLSAGPANELREAIMAADAALIVRVPGIGKKTAERIILELSGTLVKQGGATSDEAVDALERLGYSRNEAAEALRNVSATSDVRERIRHALKRLSVKP